MEQRKKKVFIQTDYVLAKTGFGKNARAIFEYLYATGKYDLVNFAIGTVDAQLDQEAERTPWKSIAAARARQIEELKRNNPPQAWEQIERMAGYGEYAIDQAVRQEKPDVFFGIQDIWGIDFSISKGWFKLIPSVLWTTLDSLPILPKAVEVAPKVQHYWSWADFATKALHKLGHTHVKTVRGAIDTTPFFRLTNRERLDLRRKYSIPPDAFIVGYVFRNQLRKSVPNLLQGYKAFKRDNPKQTTRLLLHTCWIEGWDIPKLLEENGIAKEEVLTTYICKSCRNYQIKPFVGPELDCPYCKAQKQQVTTHPSIGVTEAQLNEVYNLMDVYCHPFTSGGQEIPVQEAKLTELVTLVTNYSCGEDMCVDAAASLPLEWAEYREPGTQFIKASTYPTSISKQLNKVLAMKPEQRLAMGKKARQWVLDNFSINTIGKFLEDFIDSQPFASPESFDEKTLSKDPNYIVPQLEKDEEWIQALYDNILKFKDPNGVKYWLARRAEGASRFDIEQYFRKVAFDENQKMNIDPNAFAKLLDEKDKGRVLVVIPETEEDILFVTCLFDSIKKRYPTYSLYVATKPEYKELVDTNPLVHRWLEYIPQMDNQIWLEGNAQHMGFFNIAYLPHVVTQKVMTHQHNGCDTIDFSTQ